MLVDRQNFSTHFDVSRETLERLNEYERLLTKWNTKINLVSRNTLDEVWHRHFADSAQIYQYIDRTATNWLDFGSGAGFPGLIAAVLAQEQRPGMTFKLVESDKRKAAFLMTVSNALGLSAEVVTDRIEALPAQYSDVISARAVAPLHQLLTWATPHAQKSSVLLFPKGNNYESELTNARKHWHIESETFPSITDSGSVILRIRDIKRVD